MNDSEPILSVGLLTADSAVVTTHGPKGDMTYTLSSMPDNHIAVNGDIIAPGHRGITLTRPGETFTVSDVVIGIGFHWQQNIDLTFEGICRVITDGNQIIIVNDIGIERYLESVISSEMSPDAAPALLEAHAVISRSWVMAQLISHRQPGQATDTDGKTPDITDNAPAESSDCSGHLCVIKWYDHDDHTLFDVCADDHCQRYQGITRVTNPGARDAVAATKGLVITDSTGNLCDARFSKCCGGITEQFSACWDDTDYDYLKPIADTSDTVMIPDLTTEKGANQWIKSRPDAWCANPSDEILAQVLNHFDLDTTDFYRWTVTYRADELGRLITRRSGLDLGDIVDIIPLRRGASGRIILLKIVGSKQTVTVGKELEIRRWLSESHLYSSAFTVDKKIGDNNIATFTLTGAGWGHGVGLCQIGAAVMAASGISYDRILSHYYPGAKLTRAY